MKKPFAEYRAKTAARGSLVLTAFSLALSAGLSVAQSPYTSPYAVSGLNSAYVSDIGNTTTGRMGDAVNTTTPTPGSWYDQSAFAPTYTGTQAQGVEWGPQPLLMAQPTLPVGVAGDAAATQAYYQQRVIAAAFSLLGTPYQHHHDPVWDPSTTGTNWPWNAVSSNTTSTVYQPVLVSGTYRIEATSSFPNPYYPSSAVNGPGIDCSDTTALAYNVGAGIYLNSDVGEQGEVSVGGIYSGPSPIGFNNSGTSAFILPTSPTNPSITPITPTFITGPNTIYNNGTGTTGFNEPGSLTSIIAQFQPGDLLYIVDTSGTSANVTHVVMWLGQYGTLADGSASSVPLVISSHDNTPAMLDISGSLPPPGVEILPFSEDSWFYTNFSHAMRVIAVPEPSVPTLLGIAAGGILSGGLLRRARKKAGSD